MDVTQLISAHRPGHALAREFYTSEAVWQADRRVVWGREWQFAGHVSELAGNGDFILFNVLEESVIIVRDGDDIRAFANVCRHRGSRICLEPRGTVRRLTCPYHAWVYNLDGSLFHARHLENADTLGLRPVAIEVLAGLIYVSLADTPPDFGVIRSAMAPVLEPFDLANTRIAARASYSVAANWKLLLENYNECYHCAGAHPEFSRSHATYMPENRVAPLNEARRARSLACGAPTDFIDGIHGGGTDFAYNRYALMDGFDTGSEDGQPLAPLLGALRGYDGAASDAYVGILNPMLLYCDHAVLYRFLPLGKDHSVQEILWLVRDTAQDGRDYDRDRLTWLWDVTTRADKRIVESNAAGVASRYYTPGPLVGMERYVQRFIDTYFANLQEHI